MKKNSNVSVEESVSEVCLDETTIKCRGTTCEVKQRMDMTTC